MSIFLEATSQTKQILNTIDDDTFLYNSLFKVFQVFVQQMGDDDEDPEFMSAPTIKQLDSEESKNSEEQRKEEFEKMLVNMSALERK